MKTPTIHQLKRGLQIAEQIATLESEMAAIFKGGESPALSSSARAKVPGTRGGKRRLSPQALANIRAAQKKRWANFRGGKAPAKAAPAKKNQRAFSRAHLAKLAAAAKKRWAAIRAGKLPSPFTTPKG